mmetsp:Transcript_4536/g.28816  ORF Transcript_4536/g.28816 Transcript_4536/m.28816 type:complete len:253 (-) Transcript_4536:273-1031(-)
MRGADQDHDEHLETRFRPERIRHKDFAERPTDNCVFLHVTSFDHPQTSNLQDPEGILGQPAGGHIERRTRQKTLQQSEEEQEANRKAQEEERQAIMQKREARVVPTSPIDLIEYFLDTESQEMEYEIARCRPYMNEDFFKHLDQAIGTLRFSSTPEEDRLAELEALREVLKTGVEALDQMAANVAAPAQRAKELLQAKDKKQKIQEMAATNQIDNDMLNILRQNAMLAREAGNDEVGTFIDKVIIACQKFLI